MSDQRFTKAERLKSRKVIQSLFREGQSFAVYPLRVVYLSMEPRDSVPAKFTVSVAKKKFPHAVDRNAIKRRVREAYRLRKAAFYQNLDAEKETLALLIIFTGNEKMPYANIEGAMEKLLKRLAKKINSSNQPSPKD